MVKVIPVVVDNVEVDAGTKQNIKTTIICIVIHLFNYF